MIALDTLQASAAWQRFANPVPRSGSLPSAIKASARSPPRSMKNTPTSRKCSGVTGAGAGGGATGRLASTWPNSRHDPIRATSARRAVAGSPAAGATPAAMGEPADGKVGPARIVSVKPARACARAITKIALTAAAATRNPRSG